VSCDNILSSVVLTKKLRVGNLSTLNWDTTLPRENWVQLNGVYFKKKITYRKMFHIQPQWLKEGRDGKVDVCMSASIFRFW